MLPFQRLLVGVLLLFAGPAVGAQEVFRSLRSPDQNVRSVAVAGDTVYAGGDFGLVAAPTGQAAVLDKSTGEPDLSQARVNGGVVWTVITDGAGGWYAGGEFEQVDRTPRRNLVHVLPDGTVDPAFRPDPQATGSPFYFGSVEELVLQGGVLYVGGRFDVAAGQPRRNLTALDAATGALLPLSITMTSDNGGGGDARGYLSTIAVRDGVVYFSGLFSEVNGVPRREAAAVRATTGQLLPWDVRAEFDGGGVGALVFGDSTLYVGGTFDRIGGLPRPRGAEVSLADPVTGVGGVPTPWVPAQGFGGSSVVTPDYIWSFVYSATELLYRIDRRTGAAQPFVRNTPYRLAYAMAFDPTGGPAGQGTFYVAASKDDPDAPRSRYNAVVAVDAATLQLTGYEVLAGTGSLGNAQIRALAVEPGSGGRVFAGGEPAEYEGTPRRFLAGLDLTTGRVTPFGAEFLVNSSVEETAVSPDERFLYFATFNGIGVGDLTTGELFDFPGNRPLAERRAAWARAARPGGAPTDSSLVARPGPVVMRRGGTPASDFRPPPVAEARGGASPRVLGGTSALVATDDRLYYTPFGFGAVAYDRATGAELWATPFGAFDVGPNVARALLVEGGPPGAAGDTLFASGAIFSAGGQTRNLFVALDAATGAVLDWNAGAGAPTSGAYGSALATAPAGDRLYLGGAVAVSATGQRDLFAALRSSGAAAPWTPNAAGRQLAVRALAAQAGPDGRASVVYAAHVPFVQGGAPGTIGAFDAVTGARLAWDPRAYASGRATTLVLAERTGWVVAAGSFPGAGPGGHANLVAVRPAVPFAVVGEGGVPTPSVRALVLAGPNPFRSRTALALTLAASGPVEASLFDVLGRRVAVLHDGVLAAGSHALAVDASAFPAGVYVARVTGDGLAEALTLTVVR